MSKNVTLIFSFAQVTVNNSIYLNNKLHHIFQEKACSARPKNYFYALLTKGCRKIFWFAQATVHHCQNFNIWRGQNGKDSSTLCARLDPDMEFIWLHILSDHDIDGDGCVKKYCKHENEDTRRYKRNVRFWASETDIRKMTWTLSYLGRYNDRTSWPFRTINATSIATSYSASTRVKIAALLA